MIPLAPAASNEVVIISGLPRSGTSLMMAMLRAGGLPLLTDEMRAADVDNPKGYFELEAVKRLRSDTSWLAEARGKAVKIVVPLAQWLPAGLPCCVLLMERDLDEIVASQAAMLRRKGVALGLPPVRLKAALQAQLDQARAVLASRPNCKLLVVAYSEILQQPETVAARVAGFLECPLNIPAMAALRDPQLYRQRKAMLQP